MKQRNTKNTTSKMTRGAIILQSSQETARIVAIKILLDMQSPPRRLKNHLIIVYTMISTIKQIETVLLVLQKLSSIASELPIYCRLATAQKKIVQLTNYTKAINELIAMRGCQASFLWKTLLNIQQQNVITPQHMKKTSSKLKAHPLFLIMLESTEFSL